MGLRLDFYPDNECIHLGKYPDFYEFLIKNYNNGEWETTFYVDFSDLKKLYEQKLYKTNDADEYKNIYDFLYNLINNNSCYGFFITYN